MIRWLLTFLGCGALATLGDAGHVHWQVTAYAEPGQPWWVLPLMGSGALGMTVVHSLMTRGLGERGRPRASLAEVTIAAGLFLGCYLASCLLREWPVPLAVGFGVLFAVRAWRERGTVVWLHGLGAAVAGPVIEALLISQGAFHYAVPHPLGFPVWLPGLYLQAALLGRAVDRRWPLVR